MKATKKEKKLKQKKKSFEEAKLEIFEEIERKRKKKHLQELQNAKPENLQLVRLSDLQQEWRSVSLYIDGVRCDVGSRTDDFDTLKKEVKDMMKDYVKFEDWEADEKIEKGEGKNHNYI